MHRLLYILPLALLPTLTLAQCPPSGWSAQQLQALGDAQFAIEPAAARDELALSLLDCLADPDPRLRDAVAFEGLSHWLRANALSPPARLRIYEQLLPRLEDGGADAGGFRRPFAALMLSELARSDRMEPWLEARERAALVGAAARYLDGVRDYRGFDALEGWRHGVAHGADLALQLVLNPAVDKMQIERLLAAVARQVAPQGEHAYVFGESARLARPVLQAAVRGLQDAGYWQTWFAQIAAPAPLPDWNAAFGSRRGLARRHNVRTFLLEVYAAARDAEQPGLAALAPLAQVALRQVP
jgi:hypothetical protein